MLLRKTYRFEASHVLPKHPGKCSRLHGHSWVLHVSVEGGVSPVTGFVMDYADISMLVRPLVESLDHRHLGAWAIPRKGIDLSPNTNLDYWEPWAVPWLPHDFYPTSENLLIVIGQNLPAFWSKLAIEETCTSYAELTKEEFRDTQKR